MCFLGGYGRPEGGEYGRGMKYLVPSEKKESEQSSTEEEAERDVGVGTTRGRSQYFRAQSSFHGLQVSTNRMGRLPRSRQFQS